MHSVSDVSALFQAAVSHGLGTNPAAVRVSEALQIALEAEDRAVSCVLNALCYRMEATFRTFSRCVRRM